ncbi:MAG: hypothetical protein QOE93_1660 [Actinomycetota bacterium]|nr:hypothetical protein [Actinomycetota bacterium]
MDVVHLHPRLRARPEAVALLLAAMTLLSPAVASARGVFPDVIALPQGWRPEGITRGWGATMLSGSLATGDILAVDVIAGDSHLVVDAPPGRTASGIKQDPWGRIWAAGGATGQAFVYGADGKPLATIALSDPAATFINDVVVSRDGAWFTDSSDDVLYEVPIGPGGSLGPPRAVTVTGDYQHQPGFNLNGIEVTPGGRWLIAVQSNRGRAGDRRRELQPGDGRRGGGRRPAPGRLAGDDRQGLRRAGGDRRGGRGQSPPRHRRLSHRGVEPHPDELGRGRTHVAGPRLNRRSPHVAAVSAGGWRPWCRASSGWAESRTGR